MVRPAQRSAVTAILAGGAVCVGLAFASALTPPALITSVPTDVPNRLQEQALAPTALAPTLAPLPTQPPGAGSPVFATVLAVVGTIVAVLAVAALVLLVIRVLHAMSTTAAPAPIGETVAAEEVDVRELQEAVRRAREQIELAEDANRAVVRCWESLEELGARAGIARGASETAAEYVVGFLAALDVPSEPVGRLSQLYARALFSAERLSPASVVQARSDLDEIDAALSRPVAPRESATAQGDPERAP